MKNIAIIGAGLTGLTLASRLSLKAHVTVFEKSRGLGGRMATRYTDDFEFDHGAQYFTAKSDAFKEFVADYRSVNAIDLWRADLVTLKEPVREKREKALYVGAPRMNALAKAIAKRHDLSIENGSEIKAIDKGPNGWKLIDQSGQPSAAFDYVLVTAPAPQTANLLPTALRHKYKLDAVKMVGCFTMMIGLQNPLDLDWGGARIENSPIGWIALNDTKPGRQTGPSLVIQSTNQWAEEHMEHDPNAVSKAMLEALEGVLPIEPNAIAFQNLHRWRYANTIQPLGISHIWDEAAGIGVAGDWCLEGRVEAAFLSGNALSDDVIAKLQE